MEKWQRDAIEKNMELLYEQTTFCPAFLDSLQTNKLIGSDESPEFERIKKHEEYGHYKCNQYLYNVLKTRCKAYDILIDLLKEYNQPELAGILEEEKTAKLEDSPVLAEGHEPASDMTSGNTILKRPYNFSIAGSSRSHKSRKLLFDLQDPTPLFVGRKQELADVHKLLNESNRRAVITHITSVSGLGGIGKTQLARKYAQDYKDNYDNNIAWVNAENEESITSSFLNLASDKLGISTKNSNGKEKDIKIVVGDCYEYFERRKWKCLFIFDNMEKEKYLQKFLPKKDISQFIYVLITSRQQDWGKSVSVIGLDVFSEEEGIEFVKNGLEIDGGLFDNDITCLVRRLQYFPLAICQAVSYILNEQKMDEYSIVKYLDDFEKNSGHLLDFDLSDELESDYTKTTYTTWKMTIEKVAQTPEYGCLAVTILNVVAYFSPDDIYRDSFFKLEECTESMVKQAVNLLIKYSMVSAKESQSIFSIHRLVQEVIIADLRRTQRENKMIHLALQLSQKCLSEKFLPHAISAWSYAKGAPEIFPKYVSLATDIMRKFQNVGRYNEACQFGVNSLESLKSSPVVNKQTFLDFESYLGDVFRYAGDYEHSLYHLEHVQEECNALGNNDTFLLQVQEQIAWVFKEQGRHSEALDLGLKICQSKKSIFGEEHLSTAESLFKTAAFARNTGKYDLSYLTFQEGFTCYEKAVDKNQVSFLYARHNYANLIADRGDCAGALAILEDVHAKLTANSGLEAPVDLKMGTLRSISNYLNSLDKHSEAYTILQELYAEQKIVLGEDHRGTLSTLIELGRSLLHMKRLEEAYSACNSAHLKLKEIFGSDSESALDALQYCAEILSHQGQHFTAILYINTVVETFEKTLELTSSQVLYSKINYAEILARANRRDEALVILEGLKHTYLQVFGAEHREYIDCIEFIEKIKLGGSELRDFLEL